MTTSLFVFFFVEYLLEDGRKRPSHVGVVPQFCILSSNYSEDVGVQAPLMVTISYTRLLYKVFLFKSIRGGQRVENFLFIVYIYL
jgi:hypothetical protein